MRAFAESQTTDGISDYKQTEIIGFNPSVKRVVAFIKHGENMLTVAKGLPAKIMNTEAGGGVDNHQCQWKVNHYDNKRFMKNVTEADNQLSEAGYKTIGIAMCEGDARRVDHGPWKFVGLMPMMNPPQADTRATIESLHRANISVKSE